MRVHSHPQTVVDETSVDNTGLLLLPCRTAFRGGQRERSVVEGEKADDEELLGGGGAEVPRGKGVGEPKNRGTGEGEEPFSYGEDEGALEGS
jgi:hypothetical protein